VRFDIPFHPSDFFFFGLNQDIKTYFMDTPLVEEPYYSHYFKDPDKLLEKELAFDGVIYRYPPEQYFTLSCFKRHFSDIKMENYSDTTPENIKQSEIAIVNNFIILEYKQHGIYTNKHACSKDELLVGDKQYFGLYNNLVYFEDYKKYCDPTFEIPKDSYKHKNEKLLRVKKHIGKIRSKKTPLIKKLEKIFISIPVSTIALLTAFFISREEDIISEPEAKNI